MQRHKDGSGFLAVPLIGLNEASSSSVAAAALAALSDPVGLIGRVLPVRTAIVSQLTAITRGFQCVPPSQTVVTDRESGDRGYRGQLSLVAAGVCYQLAGRGQAVSAGQQPTATIVQNFQRPHRSPVLSSPSLLA